MRFTTPQIVLLAIALAGLAVEGAIGLAPAREVLASDAWAEASDWDRWTLPGEPPPAAPVPSPEPIRRLAPEAVEARAASGRLDVNQASAEELIALPGIGPVSARAIVEHRDRHGSFASLDDLTAVKGIGPRTVERLRAHARAGDGAPAAAAAPSERRSGGSARPDQPSERVNINTAAAAELETLPGIGPALAARILEYRESRGRFATIEQLDEVKGIGPRLMERLRPRVKLED